MDPKPDPRDMSIPAILAELANIYKVWSQFKVIDKERDNALNEELDSRQLSFEE